MYDPIVAIFVLMGLFTVFYALACYKHDQREKRRQEAHDLALKRVHSDRCDDCDHEQHKAADSHGKSVCYVRLRKGKPAVSPLPAPWSGLPLRAHRVPASCPLPRDLQVHCFAPEPRLPPICRTIAPSPGPHSFRWQTNIKNSHLKPLIIGAQGV